VENIENAAIDNIAGAGTSVKVIGLLSGGVDSALATRIMKKLGFGIIALNFMSPFCNCTHKDHGCKNEAKRLADELGIPARLEYMGQAYIDIVRNPKFGHGKNMNPCVDCRVMIFRRAKEIMEEEGAAFIFTGEVVGQRSMSQKIDRMMIIEKEAGLAGMVVRPLSAKLLPPTTPEKKGLIDRETMLAIHGKSRKDQFRISREEFGVTDNLCSSGGCLLTDPSFAVRMKDLLAHDDSADVKDARLLRLGRHYRVSDSLKLIVGRNEEENEKLLRMAEKEDFIFYPVDGRGPTTLVKGKLDRELIALAGSVTARYCDVHDDGAAKIGYRMKGSENAWTALCEPASEETLRKFRL
jgi:tRNA U34 2-thiouridine synthase MnmA/TrmU